MSLFRPFICMTLGWQLLFSSACSAAIDPFLSRAGTKVGEQSNSIAMPEQILETGINIFSVHISEETKQLALELKIIPLLEHIQALRNKVEQQPKDITLETLAARQELSEALIKAEHLIQRSSLEVDFTLAQIGAEQNIYNELLSTYRTDRDRAVSRTNAASFYANGALWAVAEGLTIPTYRYPRYSIPSGVTGILAGIIPSVASLYAMHQFGGKRQDSVADPNMLCKVFDYPITPEIDYPESVWNFLNTVPAGDKSGKTRRNQLIERWLRDRNIPYFTDTNSKKQLEMITGSTVRKNGLSIEVLEVRHFMLQQLGSEIMKMKRLLLELSMVVGGEKRI